MIYLASPYSDPDPEEMERRYLIVMEANAHYMRLNKPCYSSIVHCHMMAKKYHLPKEFEFWRQFDFHMIALAASVHVLFMDGAWKSSVGVNAEIEYARGQNKPVRLVNWVNGELLEIQDLS